MLARARLLAGRAGARCASNLIDGKAISKTVLAECAVATERLVSNGLRPGLAVILVGERADSATYVKAKRKACADVGISDLGVDYGDEVGQDELMGKIRELNGDPAVHGILVQLPLPEHLDEAEVRPAARRARPPRPRAARPPASPTPAHS